MSGELLDSGEIRNSNRQALVEPLAFVPAENFGGAKVVDSLRRRVPGFFLRLAGEVVGVFLVGNLSDRVAVPGLMRFAGCNVAVSGAPLDEWKLLTNGARTVIEPPFPALSSRNKSQRVVAVDRLEKEGQTSRDASHQSAALASNSPFAIFRVCAMLAPASIAGRSALQG